MKLVNLVRDIILEQAMDFNSGTYKFSDINVREDLIYFNNIELVDDNPIFGWHKDDEAPTPEFKLVGEGGTFLFPSMDCAPLLVKLVSGQLAKLISCTGLSFRVLACLFVSWPVFSKYFVLNTVV